MTAVGIIVLVFSSVIFVLAVAFGAMAFGAKVMKEKHYRMKRTQEHSGPFIRRYPESEVR